VLLLGCFGVSLNFTKYSDNSSSVFRDNKVLSFWVTAVAYVDVLLFLYAHLSNVYLVNLLFYKCSDANFILNSFLFEF